MNFKHRQTNKIGATGFTGIIAQNSNVVVENSFIKKGTSFINAFDNSNIVLKNCGSPEPFIYLTTDLVNSLNNNLKHETSKCLLPKWINYKFERKYNGDKQKVYYDSNTSIQLPPVWSSEVDSDITKYRNNLLNSSKNNCSSSEYMIEAQCLENGKDTADISVTAPGIYFLKDIDSSIRAVWPFTSNSKIDRPSITLHFINREVFPLKDNNGDEIKINGIEKVDNTGRTVALDSTTELFSSKTHKHIANTLYNLPKYEYETESGEKVKYKFPIDSNNNTYIPIDNIFSTYYLLEPYYNEKTIVYDVVNTFTNEKTRKNDEEPLTLYFNYDDNDPLLSSVSLYDFFNRSNKLSSSLSSIELISSLYNINLISSGSGIAISSQNKEDENSDYGETYSVYGFSKKGQNDNDENKFYNVNNEDITNEVLGFEYEKMLSGDCYYKSDNEIYIKSPSSFLVNTGYEDKPISSIISSYIFNTKEAITNYPTINVSGEISGSVFVINKSEKNISEIHYNDVLSSLGCNNFAELLSSKYSDFNILLQLSEFTNVNVFYKSIKANLTDSFISKPENKIDIEIPYTSSLTYSGSEFANISGVTKVELSGLESYKYNKTLNAYSIKFETLEPSELFISENFDSNNRFIIPKKQISSYIANNTTSSTIKYKDSIYNSNDLSSYIDSILNKNEISSKIFNTYNSEYLTDSNFNLNSYILNVMDDAKNSIYYYINSGNEIDVNKMPGNEIVDNCEDIWQQVCNNTSISSNIIGLSSATLNILTGTSEYYSTTIDLTKSDLIGIVSSELKEALKFKSIEEIYSLYYGDDEKIELNETSDPTIANVKTIYTNNLNSYKNYINVHTYNNNTYYEKTTNDENEYIYVKYDSKEFFEKAENILTSLLSFYNEHKSFTINDINSMNILKNNKIYDTRTESDTNKLNIIFNNIENIYVSNMLPNIISQMFTQSYSLNLLSGLTISLDDTIKENLSSNICSNIKNYLDISSTLSTYIINSYDQYSIETNSNEFKNEDVYKWNSIAINQFKEKYPLLTIESNNSCVDDIDKNAIATSNLTFKDYNNISKIKFEDGNFVLKTSDDNDFSLNTSISADLNTEKYKSGTIGYANISAITASNNNSFKVNFDKLFKNTISANAIDNYFGILSLTESIDNDIDYSNFNDILSDISNKFKLNTDYKNLLAESKAKGITYDGSKFVISDKLKYSNNYIIPTENDGTIDRLYFNNNILLPIINKNSYDIYISDSNYTISLDSNIRTNKLTDFLYLYYDEDCTKCLYHDSNGYLYKHDLNGSPKKNSYVYVYSYALSGGNELASFNDWYNIDTYINYNSINESRLGNYYNSSSSDGIIFTDEYAELSEEDSYICLSTQISNESDEDIYTKYDFSSLFVKDNSTSDMSYKMLSFNFKIPKNSWINFDEAMYKENPNYGFNIKNNEILNDVYGKHKTISIDTEKRIEYNLKFIANYHYLKTGTNLHTLEAADKYENYIYSTNVKAIIRDYTNNNKILTLSSPNNSSLNKQIILNSDNNYEKTDTLPITFKMSFLNENIYIQIPDLRLYVKYDNSTGKLILSFTYSSNKHYVFGENFDYNTCINSSLISSCPATLYMISGFGYCKNTISSFITSVPKYSSEQISSAEEIYENNIKNKIFDSYEELKSYLNEMEENGISGEAKLNLTSNKWYCSSIIYLPNTITVDTNTNNYTNEIKNASYSIGNIMSYSQTYDQKEYLANWLSLADIYFVSEEDSDDISNDLLIKNRYEFIDEEYSTISSYYDLPSSNIINNGSNGLMSMTDMERFVKPYDVSTNLFYYKAESESTSVANSNITANSEVVMINARKMYSFIDENETKPANSNFSFNMSSLSSTELILTGYIPIENNTCDCLKQQIPFVSGFTYKIAEKDSTYFDTLNENYTEVRYIDSTDNGSQWILYKLSNDIKFSSVDPINLEFYPTTDTLSSIEETDKFTIPCKLSLTFNDLIFKQKLRNGSSFDNVENIEYSYRIIPSSIVSGAASEVVNSWNTIDITSSYIYTKNDKGKYFRFDLSKLASELNTISGSFGGSGYFNDIITMNAISNSANKWKTTSVNTKYSDLQVFSDYYPNNTNNKYKCIGTPYLNLDKILTLNEINSKDSNIKFTRTAELVKIATDDRNISNIYVNNEKILNANIYPSALCSSTISNTICNTYKNILTCDIDIEVEDTTQIGLLELDLTDKIDIEDNSEFKVGIYLDGLLYNKDAYLISSPSFKYNEAVYNITSIDTENTELLLTPVEDSSKGYLKGTIAFDIELNNDFKTIIELHNVKPSSPTINNIGISFDNSILSSLYKGQYILDNDKQWQKLVLLQSLIRKYKPSNSNEQPYFSLQNTSNNDLRSEISEDYDDNGNLIGLNVRLKINGLKKFDHSGNRICFYNPREVKLSSDYLVNEYRLLSSYNIEQYTENASFGSTVISGLISKEYNSIFYNPITGELKDVGSYDYKYNYKDDDKFQLEIITKNKDEKYNKSIYMVNLPTDKWYNLSLYRYNEHDKSASTNNSKIGLYLTDVDEDNINNIKSSSNEVFNCFTANESFVKGKITTISDDLKNTIIPNHPSLIDYNNYATIELDPCSRRTWNMYYTTDLNYLKNKEVTNEDYEKTSRKNIDLFKPSLKLDNDINFVNRYAVIKLFNNEELYTNLNTSINNCRLYNENSGLALINYNTESLDGNTIAENNGIIRKTSIGTSQDYYVIYNKDFKYHLQTVSGLQFKSIMWISTPNLSFKANNNETKYFETYYESKNALNEYISLFGNPQNLLPPVKYTYQILSSDYATFIYNNLRKYNAQTFSVDYKKYNYENNPSTVAYVWNNSKISRIETELVNNEIENRLYWSIPENKEYISEVGSIYNYKNSEVINDLYNVYDNSITERQTTLLPKLGSPFTMKKEINDNKATVSISIDDDSPIIATAALGYNNSGFPKNAVMVYNSNDSVSIDTDQTTYFYISKDENASSCKFGSTEEKPIYVDSIQVNTCSYSEKLDFLSDPDVFNIDLDGKMLETNNNYDNYECNNNNLKLLFEYGNADSSKLSLIEKYSNYKYYSTNSYISVYSIFNYDDKSVYHYTDSTGSEKVYVKYVGNLLAFDINDVINFNINSFNVFYDYERFNKLCETTNTISLLNKPWKTAKCFDQEGLVIEKEAINNYSDFYTSEKVDERTEIKFEEYKTAIEEGYTHFNVEPSIAIMWVNNNLNNSYSKFENDISTYSYDSSANAIFDSYYSTNLTGVKVRISSEHLRHAPVLIEISLLKAVEGNNDTINFEWIHNDLFDINLISDYESEYDYDSTEEKIIEKQFTSPDLSDISLIKHIFGIKFTIKQIVPQIEMNNQCIIDDIKIYTSNILNKYGQAVPVEDTFVRKADANCRDHYNMSVDEYIWNIPNTASEWKSVKDVLSSDVENNKFEFIDETAFKVITPILNNLCNNKNEENVTEYITNSSNNFSYLNTYYISSAGKNEITEIISDNYLNDNENISITWKYIDYVYIYYTCYNDSAYYLLEKYFGSKIYNAVRKTLNNNLKELNYNSAFKDKYHFSGGIAVEKSDFLNENTTSFAYEWTINKSESINWTPVYSRFQTVDNNEYIDTQYTDYYKNYISTDGKHYGELIDTEYESTTSVASSYIVKGNVTSYRVTENKITDITKNEQVVYENPKYSSTDSWVASFEPISIKYKIE